MKFSPSLFKLASTTYSPTASAARNYTPAPIAKPVTERIDTGVTAHVVNPLKRINTGMPKPSGNTATKGPWYSTFNFLHPFTPTVSGTGSGRQYWEPRRNPFES